MTRHTRLDDLPEFLTPDEARIVLSLGRGTNYELLKNGSLDSIRFGRVIRIHKASIVKMSNGHMKDG